jgi:transcriptional regulator with XRE-family HTH domain
MRGRELPMITKEERAFFEAFGREITELRRKQGLTQAQLADALGVSQQQVASYEVGRRRVPLSMLPTLARALAVSVEELVGEGQKPTRRGPTPKLQQQLERISQLPRARQRFVSEMLDTVLQQTAGAAR